MNVTVVGAGSWGTAVAGLLSADAVTLWARRPDVAQSINLHRANPDYLINYQVPDGVSATADLEEAVTDADLLIWGVPSHGYRAVLAAAAPLIAPTTPIVSLSKGIEQETLMRMTEVTSDVLPDHDRNCNGVLTGPNLAREIAEGQPAAAVIAMADKDLATRLQAVFHGPSFRVYTNTDVIGAESAGALKNVMAIGAGMAHGMGFGMNSIATFITRALFELTRVGTALGGKPLTFAGLAGMGDLIATCMSDQSRNHRVGHGIGQGKTVEQIVAEMNMVAEGVKSTRGILAIAEREGVDVPIAEQVGRVLYEGATAAEVLGYLMGRAAGSETEGLIT
ncbi:MAG: NAD(P)-dependent glycerol-3-phosphate dehydrogenase [Acidimicrobiia bacterium]|nr:NAD(P)-dependent glycerol-3-phosphate dehydrogenase [Acidimicrobiia bacterium]